MALIGAWKPRLTALTGQGGDSSRGVWQPGAAPMTVATTIMLARSDALNLDCRAQATHNVTN